MLLNAGGGLMQTVGALLGGIVICYIAVALAHLRRQAYQARVRGSLAVDLIHQQIKAVSLLRSKREEEQLCWNGYRKFRVSRKVRESDDVCSLYLEPQDGKKLPGFQPGQFVTIRLRIAGHDKPIVRCYTVSSRPHEKFYRVTVKRTENGLASGFIHEEINEGSVLDVQAPRGSFHLDPERTRPAVLIAGGVGVTPFVSMIEAASRDESSRELTLFYCVRSHREHVMAEQLEKLAAHNDHIRILTVYSDPEAGEMNDRDADGRGCDFVGHISIDMLRTSLSSSNFDFYVCGPPSMMQSLMETLSDWGVPAKNIFTEAFGTSSADVRPDNAKVSSVNASSASGHTVNGKAVATGSPKVSFTRAGKTATWTSDCCDIMTLASNNGVEMEAGCNIGNCGTCETALRSGKVSYPKAPVYPFEKGTCLPCVAVPVEDVELDA